MLADSLTVEMKARLVTGKFCSSQRQLLSTNENLRQRPADSGVLPESRQQVLERRGSNWHLIRLRVVQVWSSFLQPLPCGTLTGLTLQQYQVVQRYLPHMQRRQQRVDQDRFRPGGYMCCRDCEHSAHDGYNHSSQQCLQS